MKIPVPLVLTNSVARAAMSTQTLLNVVQLQNLSPKSDVSNKFSTVASKPLLQRGEQVNLQPRVYPQHHPYPQHGPTIPVSLLVLPSNRLLRGVIARHQASKT